MEKEQVARKRAEEMYRRAVSHFRSPNSIIVVTFFLFVRLKKLNLQRLKRRQLQGPKW